MKIKTISLLLLFVCSFLIAHEEKRDSEEPTLYPRNIIEDPFDPRHSAHRDEDPFAETQRKVDALLAGESTAPPPEPKKLADASQNSSQQKKPFSARVGDLSLYASDKPIAFFDGHETDLKYIEKESVHLKLGSRKFDESGWLVVSGIKQFKITERIEDSNDVGILVEVETLEVEDRLAVSVSTQLTVFLGFTEDESGDFTPKLVSKEFSFKDDDIGKDERIFIFSYTINEEHKTMFIVLKITEE